jgi:tocopherol O-methyltransferase
MKGNDMSHEHRVREYYDVAVHCYESIMGHTWHHGDPEAEARGLGVLEAAQALEEKVVAASGLAPNRRALDFGAGVGGPTLFMAKASGAYFVGLSNNEGLNQRSRARAEDAGLSDRVSFLTTGDNDYRTLIAFGDASFDAVIFYESVCHLPDKAAFMQAAFRVLKPGGRLVGVDWLQRPFGPRQTEEEILQVMQPVNETICIPWHGTVASYSSMMQAAGFRVMMARDLFEGVKCWGSTPKDERPQWLEYSGPAAETFRKGKVVLDAAREAGVFTVGMFVAHKP